MLALFECLSARGVFVGPHGRKRHQPTPPPDHPKIGHYGWSGGGVGWCRKLIAEAMSAPNKDSGVGWCRKLIAEAMSAPNKDSGVGWCRKLIAKAMSAPNNHSGLVTLLEKML